MTSQAEIIWDDLSPSQCVALLSWAGYVPNIRKWPTSKTYGSGFRTTISTLRALRRRELFLFLHDPGGSGIMPLGKRVAKHGWSVSDEY